MAKVTAEEIADEVSTKMRGDEEFAGVVAKAVAEDDDLVEKMLDQPEFTSKITKHLLEGDSGLMDRVKGELALEGFRIESEDDQEYGGQEALKDFEILCKAAKHSEDPKTVAKACGVEVSKTMQETDFSNAGVLIPEPLMDEVIEILDPDPVFVDAGATMVTMRDTNKVGIGRQNADPTAAWEDENITITESDAGFDKLQLDGKKLTAAAAISNDFLRRDAIIAGDEFIASRLLKVARNKLETAIFRGSGGQFQPQGLLSQVDSGHVNASSGNTISNIVDDMKQAVRLLEGEDVPENMRAWFMRRDVFVDFVFDLNGNEDTFPFREEMTENGTILGDRIHTTNNVEKRTNDSNIYYVEMSEQFVGRGTDFQISTSEHQRFLDDETLVKLISHHDYKMKHTKSAAVIKDYTLQ